MRRLLRDVKPSQANKAFDYMDTDRDGVVRFQEFTKILRKYFSKTPHPVAKNALELEIPP